ncbi:uncharacterized protein PAC_15149 [Phialocephala subalpina]|uniref:Uncharacterized protein n=1 Tax=Phialocephala subalpina TaxID=576137 RepID=A0A1L7XJN7_9HELO|nr:uncharacterized protein PAC_15149 [Phialocephala subalpina]
MAFLRNVCNHYQEQEQEQECKGSQLGRECRYDSTQEERCFQSRSKLAVDELGSPTPNNDSFVIITPKQMQDQVGASGKAMSASPWHDSDVHFYNRNMKDDDSDPAPPPPHHAMSSLEVFQYCPIQDGFYLASQEELELEEKCCYCRHKHSIVLWGGYYECIEQVLQFWTMERRDDGGHHKDRETR